MSPLACERGRGETGPGRYGAACRGANLWPRPERDQGLSSNTILPAYSPLWLPAATHNEAHCRGLPVQKGPLERWLPSGGLSPLFPLSTSGRRWEREEKLNNREDTRGTMVFRGHLNPQQTVSTSVGNGWIDRHCVRPRQKGPFPCGQSHWKGYSVVLLCMRGIWSPSLFSCSWTALWCRWSDFVSLESRGKRWSKASRAGPFFPWPAPLEGWKRLLSYTSSKKRIKVGGECGPDWESEGLMLWGGDEHGHMWRVARACVCAVAPHKLRRVGVYWILMGCLGKTLSLFFYHICSQMCGLLSCEHTASIKDLFISPFCILMWKGFIHWALQHNSHSS